MTVRRFYDWNGEEIGRLEYSYDDAGQLQVKVYVILNYSLYESPTQFANYSYNPARNYWQHQWERIDLTPEEVAAINSDGVVSDDEALRLSKAEYIYLGNTWDAKTTFERFGYVTDSTEDRPANFSTGLQWDHDPTGRVTPDNNGYDYWEAEISSVTPFDPRDRLVLPLKTFNTVDGVFSTNGLPFDYYGEDANRDLSKYPNAFLPKKVFSQWVYFDDMSLEYRADYWVAFHNMLKSKGPIQISPEELAEAATEALKAGTGSEYFDQIDPKAEDVTDGETITNLAKTFFDDQDVVDRGYTTGGTFGQQDWYIESPKFEYSIENDPVFDEPEISWLKAGADASTNTSGTGFNSLLEDVKSAVTQAIVSGVVDLATSTLSGQTVSKFETFQKFVDFYNYGAELVDSVGNILDVFVPGSSNAQQDVEYIESQIENMRQTVRDEVDDKIEGAGPLFDFMTASASSATGVFRLSFDAKPLVDASLGGEAISFGAGNDVWDGKVGDDLILGGAGLDTLIGGLGNDALAGGLGDDDLSAGAGIDTLHGGAGDDVLRGGSGATYVEGGDGNDSFYVGRGLSLFDGGDFPVTDAGYTSDSDKYRVDIDSAYFDFAQSSATVTRVGGWMVVSNDTSTTFLKDVDQVWFQGAALDDSAVDPENAAIYYSAIVEDGVVTIGGVIDDAAFKVSRYQVFLEDKQGNRIEDFAAVGMGLSFALPEGADPSDYTAKVWLWDEEDSFLELSPRIVPIESEDDTTGGDDTVDGGGADDTVPGSGEDTTTGGGDDTVDGGGTDDTVPGSGEDTTAGGGDDTVDGGGSDDTVPGSGEDTTAGGGDDTVDGGGSDDTVPGSGEDTTTGGGDDTVDGGEDTVAVETPVALTLTGTLGADLLLGDVLDDHLSGFDGNDTLKGFEGNDTLHGGDGQDILSGGSGDDFIYAGATQADLMDRIYAGEGHDHVDGGYGNDEIRGDSGNDTLLGGFGADTVIGATGNDVITGAAWGDVLFGGAGNDFLNGGFGFDRLNGGSGADQFYHLGIYDHGSDWIQDYRAAEGDVMVFGGAAKRTDFMISLAQTPGAGQAQIDEAFVIHIPTAQIVWALVDGAGQSELNVRAGGQVFDLLA